MLGWMGIDVHPLDSTRWKETRRERRGEKKPPCLEKPVFWLRIRLVLEVVDKPASAAPPAPTPTPTRTHPALCARAYVHAALEIATGAWFGIHCMFVRTLSLSLSLSKSVSVCVCELSKCVCVCVCERERERHTHTHTETQRDRESDTACVCLCVTVCVCLCALYYCLVRAV